MNETSEMRFGVIVGTIIKGNKNLLESKVDDDNEYTEKFVEKI